MRSVTLPQVLLLLGVLAAIILAQRFAPGISADVVSVVGVAVAWLMKSPAENVPPAAGAIVPLLLACAYAVSACGPYLGPEQRKELVDHQGVLEGCKAKGRAARAADASPEQAYGAFEACLKDAGVP